MARKRRKLPSDNELSDYVFVDASGTLRMVLYISGEIDGVFQWDDELEFTILLNNWRGFNL